MTTITPQRPPHSPSPAPRPAAAGAGGGVAPIDPIKLIKQYTPLLVICVFVGAVLGLGAHLVLKQVAPRYESYVLYEVFPPNPDPTELDQNAKYNQDELERFMNTEVQIMTSDEVLQNTVKDPAVENQTEWAKQFKQQGQSYVHAAARELRKRLSARALSNTNIIRLSMSGTSAVDVATIVNATNRAYFEDMKMRDNISSVDQRQALQRLLADKRDSIQRMQSQRDKIVEGGLDALQQAATSASLEIFELAKQIVEVRATIAVVESQLKDFADRLKDGRVVEYPDRIREAASNDPIIRGMDNEITGARAIERQLLLAGYGDKHPEVKLVRHTIEAKVQERQVKHEATMRALFDAEVDRLRSALGAYEAQEREVNRKIEEVSARRRELLKKQLEAEELGVQIEVAQRAAEELETTIKTIESRRDLKVANRVRVLRQGQIPDRMSFPRAVIMIPAGAVLLPLLVGGLVLLRELFDQRVRSTSDIAIIPRLKVLGVVPDASEDPTRPANVATAFRDAPLGAVTESFRQLRAPLAKKMENAGHRTLLVISGMPGSGATSTVSNLAMIAGASDQRVLIIDANLRRPGVHKVFNLAEGPGLGDVLAGTATLKDAVQATSTPNVSVLAAGTPDSRRAPERLATDAMTALLREAAGSYDLVLVDTSPAVVSGDAMSLANRCDASLLVIRALAEKRGLVARLQNQFGDARAELLGVVLNGARSSAGGYLKRNIAAAHTYQKTKA